MASVEDVQAFLSRSNELETTPIPEDYQHYVPHPSRGGSDNTSNRIPTAPDILSETGVDLSDPFGAYSRLFDPGFYHYTYIDPSSGRKKLKNAYERAKERAQNYTTPFERLVDINIEWPNWAKDQVWAWGQLAESFVSVPTTIVSNTALSMLTGEPLPLERAVLPGIEALEPWLGRGTKDVVVDLVNDWEATHTPEEADQLSDLLMIEQIPTAAVTLPAVLSAAPWSAQTTMKGLGTLAAIGWGQHVFSSRANQVIENWGNMASNLLEEYKANQGETSTTTTTPGPTEPTTPDTGVPEPETPSIDPDTQRIIDEQNTKIDALRDALNSVGNATRYAFQQPSTPQVTDTSTRGYGGGAGWYAPPGVRKKKKKKDKRKDHGYSKKRRNRSEGQRWRPSSLKRGRRTDAPGSPTQEMDFKETRMASQ